MDLHLRGRFAVVTGASSGIGAGVARKLAQEGVVVAAVSRRADDMRWVADLVREDGSSPLTLIEADLVEPGAVARVAQRAAGAVGPIDILVNCAGASRPTTPGAADDVWDEAFALNFTATRKLSETLLPGMRERHRDASSTSLGPTSLGS